MLTKEENILFSGELQPLPLAWSSLSLAKYFKSSMLVASAIPIAWAILGTLELWGKRKSFDHVCFTSSSYETINHLEFCILSHIQNVPKNLVGFELVFGFNL